MPKSVTAASDFGSYTSEYAQVKDELVIRRRMAGADGVQPPERLPDFTAWLRAVSADDTRMIVLEKTTVTQAGNP